MTSSKLLINPNGNLYFNENESLIEDMAVRYPRLSFKSTLSLGEFTMHNQFHKLGFEYPLGTHDTFDMITSEHIQSRVVDTLFDYLDLISERMHQNGIDAATVHLLSIEPQDIVNAISQQRTMSLRFRAVFLNGKSDED